MHLTSRVNSTLHSAQKSSQIHSRGYCKRSTTSSEIRGINPIRCAKNSSLKTVEFASSLTQSIANVGVSAINTLLKLFATLKDTTDIK